MILTWCDTPQLAPKHQATNCGWNLWNRFFFLFWYCYSDNKLTNIEHKKTKCPTLSKCANWYCQRAKWAHEEDEAGYYWEGQSQQKRTLRRSQYVSRKNTSIEGLDYCWINIPKSSAKRLIKRRLCQLWWEKHHTAPSLEEEQSMTAERRRTPCLHGWAPERLSKPQWSVLNLVHKGKTKWTQ